MANEQLITEEQEEKFLALTMNIVSWDTVVVLVNGITTIPIEDVTFDEAVALIEYANYTAVPF